MSKTNGLPGAYIRRIMIPSQQRFVNFRWGKDKKIWLFLMLLSAQPGSVRAVDVNVDEAVAGMGRGNVGKYLTGIPAVTTKPPAVGKLTIR
ncbi:MAG: hypothetical protein SPE18_01510 [Candidatus Limivicinus sp.]|nr:hypothetical protein [Candidatus Limivicinus sp.]